MAEQDDNRVLVDTNVLLAATDRDREQHATAKGFLKEAYSGKYRAFVGPQIYREYLVIATRPVEVNGLGMTAQDACQNLQLFQSIVQMLPENLETQEQLFSLVQKYHLEGKRILDANLVALMAAHGIQQLKTFNREDFSGFQGIVFV